MKNNYLLVALAIMLSLTTYAQQERTPDGKIRCATMEADAALRAANPNLGTLEDLERWMQPKVAAYKQMASAQRAVITIPIVFHIIHNNGADNISATYINAQIDQLNQDFRKYGSGSNTNPVGADVEIEFCAATINPSGGTMSEPGIDRVSRSSKGFSTPPYSQSYYESTIKPNTIWDPTQYCNVWVSDLSGGLLGYAQFPEASSLAGIGTGNGGANTDGVVVIYSSVGSQATPFPGGGNYDGGRTLTHELGHWLGLRHIWGDGGCSVDDYCNDTPTSDAANYGCPTTHVSCGSTDMVQNYMDYTNDYCMNIFTNDQKARMQVVMSSSVRRASLANSNKCGGGGTADTQAPSTPTSLSANNITQTTATLTWNASTDNVGVVGYDVALNGTVLGTVSGTSANLTGLTASTTYSASVVAKDAAGNASGTASTSFTTLANTGGNCANSDVTVTIKFDNYPEETSWTIKNSGGSTVASGGTYASQPDGSTLNINVTLADGNYTFTINDSYGDGICCSYGSGNYALTSGGVTYASGGSFTTSEATTFCVVGSGGPCDNAGGDSDGDGVCDNVDQCPGTDDALIGTPCNDGNACTTGDVYDSNCGCSGTFQDSDGDGVCDANDVCANGDDNIDTDGDGIPDACDSGNSGSTLIFGHYFESGWDGWVDGGSDCARYSGSRSWEGTKSIRLRDNSGTVSSMTLNNVNVTGYNELELTFFFYAYSMENGEDFWVRVNDGSGWQTVAAYASGSSFSNNSFYTATVVLNSADFSFNSGFDFRFQCDASGNADYVYIDEVTLTGINSGVARNTTYSLAKVDSPVPAAVDLIKSITLEDNEIYVYPNPAKDFITIESNFENSVVRVYALSGALVKEVNVESKTGTIDVSELRAGTYIIQAESSEGVAINKFIKQ
ncbi:MAG: T9SS type A sorting domain-containing protein [Chitinophagales bacterium]